MKIILSAFCLALLIGFSPQTHAQLDSATQQALEKTQEMLKSPALRQKAISGDSGASEADSKAANAVGAENTQVLYEIAAEVMGPLTKQSHGDVTKMNEAMAKFSQDPEAFFKTLTPEQQKRIHDLAQKLSASSTKPN